MDILRINIKGAYGQTNFGDDLLMCVFENYFHEKFPGAILNFDGDKAEYTTNLLNDSYYLKKRFSPDLIVYGGGTQFFSFQNSTSLSIKKLLMYALLNPAQIIKKIQQKVISPTKVQTAFIGFGIGPFHDNQQIEEKARLELSKAFFVGVRDTVSQKYCYNWGIDSVIGADVVFSSFFNKLNNINLRSTYTLPSKKKKIGIIVRDWGWEKTGDVYIDKLLSLYSTNSDETEFQFVIFAPKKDKLWIKRLQNEKPLIWDPHQYSINDFLYKLNNFDAFITARYHGAILAALLNKPVICIEIEPKLRILCQQIPEFQLWEKPFSIDKLNSLLGNIKQCDYTKSITGLRVKADLMLAKFLNKILYAAKG